MRFLLGALKRASPGVVSTRRTGFRPTNAVAISRFYVALPIS
jgi:hypothetical protein